MRRIGQLQMVALAAAVLAAGCSSDDNGASTTTAAATTTASDSTAASAASTSTSVASTDSTATSTSGSSGSTASGVQSVVDAANAFLALLDDDQQTQVVLDFDEENATAWSNLPCGSSCRVGIQLSELTDEQQTAAKAVIQAATGTSTGAGYDQVMQILLADDVLGASQANGTGGGPGGGGGGGGYSSTNYFLAFLGSPSADGTWQLHFGGHHLALNVTYKAGEVAGATPFFIGVEPTTWTADDGTTYAPLDIMKDGMLALVQSLTTDELTEAKLSESFTDVLLGPDQDGNFPATKEGVKVSELTDDQQALVMAAIRPWVAVVDDASAEALMAQYESELDDTYVSYSGGTDLTNQGDYVRIDGPGVWIEFVAQNGVVYQNQIHYHTVYRDHTGDYGGELSF